MARSATAASASSAGSSMPVSLMHGWQALRAGTYGSFYIMSKKMKAYNRAAIVRQAISLLQMLSFLAAPNLNWHSLSSVVWLRWLSDLIAVRGLQVFDSVYASVVIFYVAVAIVASFVTLFLWTMYGFITGRVALWPIRILSAIGALCAAELYIPLLSTLLSNFFCNTDPRAATSVWRQIGFQCYQGGHLAQSVVVLVLLAGLVPLAMAFSLLFYDPMMLSRSVAARSHGRADFIFLALKTVLVVFCSTFPDTVGTWGVIGILILCGAAWLGSTTYYMSAVSHTHNRITAAAASVFFVAAVCAAISEGIGVDGGVLLYVTAPLSAVLGLTLADWRAKSIHYKPVQQLQNAVEVDLKVRYMIMDKLYGHYVDKLHTISEAIAHKQASAAAGSGLHDIEEGIVESAYLDPDDINIQIDAARRVLSKQDLADIEAVFRHSAQRFKTSAFLHICMARHYATLAQNRHLEMSHLMHAERCSPSLDIGYLIFAARKRSEDVSGSKGQMSALSRVAFEKHLADARKHTQKAIQQQVAFWSELAASRTVDITRLHHIAVAMTDAEYRAEEAFSELLALNSQSLLVLRLYSEFTLRVRNNAEKASLLVADAERIEEAAAKEHARHSGSTIRMMAETPLDIMSDATGLITISGAPHSLGIITSANPIACRMLGYSRWQLERRNISCIVPPPLQDMHDSFIKRYLASGEGTVVDYTRALLALHKHGYLVPILMCVREAAGVDANAEFLGLLRPLQTNEHYILLSDTGIVKGATQPSFEALDVEPQFLQSREVSIREWVPDWDALLPQLRSGAPVSLCLDNTHSRVYRRVLQSIRHEPSGSRDHDELLRSRVTAELSALGAGRASGSSPGDSADGDVENAANVPIKAALQEVALRSGVSFSILAWTHSAHSGSDSPIQRAASLRSASSRRQSMAAPAAATGAGAASGTPMAAASDINAAASFSSQCTADPTVAAGVPSLGATAVSAAGCPFLLRQSPGSSMLVATTSLHRDIQHGSPHSGAARHSSPPAIPGAVSLSDDEVDGTLFGSPVVDVAAAATTAAGAAASSGMFEAAPLSTSPTQAKPVQSSAAAPPRARLAFQAAMATVKMQHAVETQVTVAAHADDERGIGDLRIRAPAFEAGVAASRARDEDGSSKGSGRDSLITRRLIARLRRIVDDRDDTKLLPALASLRVTGIAVIITALLLTTIAVVISSLKFREYGLNIAAATDASSLLESGLRIGKVVRELTIRHYGYHEAVEEELQDLNAELLTQVERFDMLRNNLYGYARTAGLTRLYDDVPVNTTHYDVLTTSTSLVPSYRIISLTEAMQEYVAESRSICTIEPAAVSDAIPSVSYILTATMHGSSIHHALNESSLQWLDVSLQSRTTVTTTLLGIYIALIALLVLVGVVVLLPVLVWVDSAKDQSLRALATLPSAVVIHLRQQALRNMKQLTQDEDDDDSAEQPSDSDASADAAGQQQEPKLQEEASADGSIADVDWAKYFSRTPSAKQSSRQVRGAGASDDASLPSRSSKRRHARRSSITNNPSQPVKYRKSCWSLAVLMIKFCSPLLLVFVFVTIIYFESVRTLQHTLAAGSVAFASSQRAVLTLDTMSWLRKSLRTIGDPTEVAPLIAQTTRTLEDLEYFHRLLEFGTVEPAPQTAAALLAGADSARLLGAAFDAKLQHLMSGDMCAALWSYDTEAFPEPVINVTTVPVASAKGSLVEYGTSIDDCRARMNGAMTLSGLHGAMLEYLKRSRRANSVRAATTIDASGSGYVLTAMPNGSIVQVPTSKTELFHSGLIDDLEQCGFQYVPRGSFFVAWLYQQAATASVERFILFEAAFCACFMALCASWVMVLFIPQVHGENRDIRQQRSILLLVPAQLIRSSPCLKTLLTSIMQNADNAVGEPPALDSASSLPATVTSTTTALAI